MGKRKQRTKWSSVDGISWNEEEKINTKGQGDHSKLVKPWASSKAPRFDRKAAAEAAQRRSNQEENICETELSEVGFTKIRSKNLDVLFKREYYEQKINVKPVNDAPNQLKDSDMNAEDQKHTEAVDVMKKEEDMENIPVNDPPIKPGLSSFESIDPNEIPEFKPTGSSEEHSSHEPTSGQMSPIYVNHLPQEYEAPVHPNLYLYSPASNTLIPCEEIVIPNPIMSADGPVNPGPTNVYLAYSVEGPDGRGYITQPYLPSCYNTPYSRSASYQESSCYASTPQTPSIGHDSDSSPPSNTPPLQEFHPRTWSDNLYYSQQEYYATRPTEEIVETDVIFNLESKRQGISKSEDKSMIIQSSYIPGLALDTSQTGKKKKRKKKTQQRKAEEKLDGKVKIADLGNERQCPIGGDDVESGFVSGTPVDIEPVKEIQLTDYLADCLINPPTDSDMADMHQCISEKPLTEGEDIEYITNANSEGIVKNTGESFENPSCNVLMQEKKNETLTSLPFPEQKAETNETELSHNNQMEENKIHNRLTTSEEDVDKVSQTEQNFTDALKECESYVGIVSKAETNESVIIDNKKMKENKSQNINKTSEAEEEENSQSKQNSANVNEESQSYACMVSNAETSESVIAHDKKMKENKHQNDENTISVTEEDEKKLTEQISSETNETIKEKENYASMISKAARNESAMLKNKEAKENRRQVKATKSEPTTLNSSQSKTNTKRNKKLVTSNPILHQNEVDTKINEEEQKQSYSSVTKLQLCIKNDDPENSVISPSVNSIHSLLPNQVNKSEKKEDDDKWETVPECISKPQDWENTRKNRRNRKKIRFTDLEIQKSSDMDRVPMIEDKDNIRKDDSLPGPEVTSNEPEMEKSNNDTEQGKKIKKKKKKSDPSDVDDRTKVHRILICDDQISMEHMRSSGVSPFCLGKSMKDSLVVSQLGLGLNRGCMDYGRMYQGKYVPPERTFKGLQEGEQKLKEADDSKGDIDLD